MARARPGVKGSGKGNEREGVAGDDEEVAGDSEVEKPWSTGEQRELLEFLLNPDSYGGPRGFKMNP